MLPPINRLSRVEIANILRRGKAFRGLGLTIRVWRLKLENTPIKATIVVSAKTAKKATERNLLKRRLRNSFSSFLKQLKSGYGVVIIAYPPATTQKVDGLKRDLKVLFNQAGLLAK